MKFLVVFAFCVAVAAARLVVPDAAAQEAAEIQQILDMINHPNTDPATGAALQQLLDDILGVKPQEDFEDIAVDPVIIENEYEPISVGPAIVDPVDTVAPSSGASPLVQIIINVNSGAANALAVDRPTPVEDYEDVHPTPVIVGPGFETFPVEDVNPTPVIVGPGFETFPVEDVIPTPVIVGPGFETFPVEDVKPTPVIVGPGFETIPVDAAPEPVIVGPGFETIPVDAAPEPVIVGPGFETVGAEPGIVLPSILN